MICSPETICYLPAYIPGGGLMQLRHGFIRLANFHKTFCEHQAELQTARPAFLVEACQVALNLCSGVFIRFQNLQVGDSCQGDRRIGRQHLGD